MASYLAVSTSHEVIKVRVLNFKMAASGFVNVTEEVFNVIKKHFKLKSAKYAAMFGKEKKMRH